jgi:carbonic anhydrase
VAPAGHQGQAKPLRGKQAMNKLIQGIAEFQQKDFKENRDLFKSLATGQDPDVLFITCSDSRIDPNMITQTKPGELFICRNAGNIVPPHSPITGGITASIEYAVAVLGVKDIVICGHTDCGAMKGAMYPEKVKALHHVSNWLGHCSAAAARVKARHDGIASDEHIHELIEENVLLQMHHIQTHPVVAAKLATGSIELHGWVYDIGTGEITCYDNDKGKFVHVMDRYNDIVNQESHLHAQAS